MLKRDYPTQYCPVASTLEVIGERWTLLIIRDVFLGIRRFDDLQRDLGVARNILQVRLERASELHLVPGHYDNAQGESSGLAPPSGCCWRARRGASTAKGETPRIERGSPS